MGTRLLNLNSVLLGAGRGGYPKKPVAIPTLSILFSKCKVIYF